MRLVMTMKTQAEETDIKRRLGEATARWLESVGIPSDIPMPLALLHDDWPPAGMEDGSFVSLCQDRVRGRVAQEDGAGDGAPILKHERAGLCCRFEKGQPIIQIFQCNVVKVG